MRESNSVRTEKATRPVEQLFGGLSQNPRTAVRSNSPVVRAARRLWPEKTAAHLALRGETTLRAAEYWLAGRREPSFTAFLALLTSDEGVTFLEAIVGDLPAPRQAIFWARMKRAVRKHELRVSRKKDEAELRQLELGESR